MSHRELFSEFLENLNLDLKQAKKISYHYRKITKSLKSCVQRNEFPGSKPLESGVSRQTYRNKRHIRSGYALYYAPQSV